MTPERAVILIQCPDQKGIVARVTNFVFENGGNIINSNQHSTDLEGGRFFMRLEFLFDLSAFPKARLESGIAALAASLGAAIDVHYGSTTMRMAVAVSKYDHCLVDLLYRVNHGDLPVAIPFVVSNHDDTRDLVERYGIPFHHLPVTKETKTLQERQLLERVRDSSDFFVLARYMQILSQDFLDAYGKPVINIHHSFLPSFKGSNPYRQAFQRGVKIIGATAHYATVDLDEGPIIAQVVGPVSHRDDADSLQRKGRTLEQQALAAAIQAHLEHRVIRYENKTIVFE